MSVALYRTALYWHRHRGTGAARLDGGAIVELKPGYPADIKWPPMLEHVWFAPESGVRTIQWVGEGARDMKPNESSWCEDVIRHVCGGNHAAERSQPEGA